PTFVALPSRDLGRGRALGPDHLGDDPHARSATIEVVVEIAAVLLERTLGALIPRNCVRELDLGGVPPKRLSKNGPTRLSEDDQQVVAARQTLPHERQGRRGELVRRRVDERLVSAAATVAAVGEEVAYGSGGQLVRGDEPEHRGH